jgi:hypothetical protein
MGHKRPGSEGDVDKYPRDSEALCDCANYDLRRNTLMPLSRASVGADYVLGCKRWLNILTHKASETLSKEGKAFRPITTRLEYGGS